MPSPKLCYYTNAICHKGIDNDKMTDGKVV